MNISKYIQDYNDRILKEFNLDLTDCEIDLEAPIAYYLKQEFHEYSFSAYVCIDDEMSRINQAIAVLDHERHIAKIEVLSEYTLGKDYAYEIAVRYYDNPPVIKKDIVTLDDLKQFIFDALLEVKNV